MRKTYFLKCLQAAIGVACQQDFSDGLEDWKACTKNPGTGDKQTSKVSPIRCAHASMYACVFVNIGQVIVSSTCISQSFESPLESQPMCLLVESSKEVKK